MDDDEPKKIYRNLAILYAIAAVALLVYIVVTLTEFVKLAGGAL
jgi:tetrahydromethanopterin S-methyltransferase subunit G